MQPKTFNKHFLEKDLNRLFFWAYNSMNRIKGRYKPFLNISFFKVRGLDFLTKKCFLTEAAVTHYKTSKKYF